MPFEEVIDTSWIHLFRRWLIIGPPNTWKTSSLITACHSDEEGQLAIIQAPGELGGGSTPQGKNIRTFRFKDDPARPSAAMAVQEFRQLIIDLINGEKYGKVCTLALDGVHKLYDYCYTSALSSLTASNPKTDEDKLRGMAYGVTAKDFINIIRLAAQSNIPYMIMTAWTGREKDNPDDNKSQRHIWPDFPGQMAQNITGEVGATLFSIPGKELAPGKFSPGQWQTRPFGAVWGVGLKLPKEISSQVPTFVPQDARALDAMVMALWEKHRATLTVAK